MRRRPMRSRRRARASRTASACGGTEIASSRASSCARRRRRSNGWTPAPWADRAATEFAATGETLRRRDPSTVDELTPQELQIALLLASGKTTRETAATLFLSPKTVEYHLRHAYQKLDIHSREELAQRLAERESGGRRWATALGR